MFQCPTSPLVKKISKIYFHCHLFFLPPFLSHTQKNMSSFLGEGLFNEPSLQRPHTQQMAPLSSTFLLFPLLRCPSFILQLAHIILPILEKNLIKSFLDSIKPLKGHPLLSCWLQQQSLLTASHPFLFNQLKSTFLFNIDTLITFRAFKYFHYPGIDILM